MVLGKLPVPGRPTIWMIVGQGPIALAVGAGGGCLDIFTLLYPFSSLSPSLWETARYRLKYCLKGPLKRKQPTNEDQTENVFHSRFCRPLKEPKRPIITEGTVPEFLGKPFTVVRQVTGSIAAHPGTHQIAYPSYN